MELLESRRLLTSIQEYPVPLIGGANAAPTGITIAPNGTLAFIESGGNKIGSLSVSNPANIQSFPQTLPANAVPEGIALGPDGNIWFTEHSTDQIGVINLTGTAPTPTGISANSGPTAIVSADGFLWFTQSFTNQIGRLDPQTGQITEYNAPAYTNPFSSIPNFAITLGPDGNLWFSQLGKVLAFNPANPNVGSNLNVTKTVSLQNATAEEVFGMTAGPGGTLWYTGAVENGTGFNSSAVGVINTNTASVVKEIPVSVTNLAYGITAGPDGNIWFTSLASATVAGTIDEINPSTETIARTLTIPASTAIPIPNPNSITTGPDGNLWFTDSAGAIGVVNDTHLVVTIQPPPDVSVNAPFGILVTDEYTNGVVDTAFHGNVTVTIADNPVGGSFVPGVTTTVTAVNGMANFGLEINKAGMGYVLGASSSATNGPTATNTVGFNVVNGPATQFIVAVQPVSPVPAGGAFTVSVVDVYVNAGGLNTAFNGSVIVQMGANPGGGVLGGITSVAAVNGVATFPGLTISSPGNGYTLNISSAGVISAATTPFNVTPFVAPPPAPTITGEVVAFTHKMKKGKPVGKPIFAGYTIDFSEAMDQTSLANGGHYQLGIFVVKIVKRKKTTVLKPIGFTVTGMTSNSVTLKPRGTQTFPKGGQLTVLAGGVLSAAEVPLAVGGAFNISKGGKGIS